MNIEGNINMKTMASEEMLSIKNQIDHDLNDVTSQLRRAFENEPITCLNVAFFVPELLLMSIPGCGRTWMGMQALKKKIANKVPKYYLDNKHRDTRAAGVISAAVKKLEMIENRLKDNAEYFHKEIVDVRFKIDFFGGVVN